VASVTDEDKMAYGRIEFWCYLYYVSKYYELLDTAIRGVLSVFVLGV